MICAVAFYASVWWNAVRYWAPDARLAHDYLTASRYAQCMAHHG